MKNCISVDWLQCHVKLPRQDFENLFNSLQTIKDQLGRNVEVVIKKVEKSDFKELDNRYLLVRSGIQTRNFKAIFEIKDKATGEDIAVLAAEPRSLMCMDESSGLIKIMNKYLYQKNFLRFTQNLLKDLQLQFINITRLDLAYDFLSFDTMSCKDFITSFANRFYLKKQQAKFKMMGDSWSVDKGKLTGGISSLKFGLETSDVNYYLYNKTLELSQVKDKPWIKEHWLANGWDGITDVWRLEFSLHPDTKGIGITKEIDFITQDRELIKRTVVEKIYHFKDLEMLDHIDEVYQFYFNRHFQFVQTEITKKGNYKKQSRCRDVILFHSMTFEGVKISLSDKKDSGRSAKVFAKKLMEFNQEMRGQDFELAIAGNEMFTYVIQKYGLDEWRQKKLPQSNLSQRIVDLFARSRNAQLLMQIQSDKRQPDYNVFKTRQQQELELQQQLLEFQMSKWQLVPDGKVVFYNDTGEISHFADAPF